MSENCLYHCPRVRDSIYDSKRGIQQHQNGDSSARSEIVAGLTQVADLTDNCDGLTEEQIAELKSGPNSMGSFVCASTVANVKV